MDGQPPFLPPSKFGSGVIGKTSHVAIANVGVWALAVGRLGENLTLNLSLIGAASLTTIFAVFYVRSSQKFAEENPAQALLEGASLVDLRRAEMEAKGGTLKLSNPVELKPQDAIQHEKL